MKRPRGRPSNHAGKREDLINGASVLFNERGISGTNLESVAEVVGISRASAYHYVRDRNDLVYQCYMRACEIEAGDLDAASSAPNGLARTTAFIRHALTPDRPPAAVLTEVNSLAPGIAGAVRKAHNRNADLLRQFIRDGIQDGSIRPCDSDIAAQAIVGMLSWSQLLPQWSQGRDSAGLRERAACAMIDLLTHGLARKRRDAFRCDLDVEAFRLQVDDIFDREQSSALKVARVLETASRLFNRQGIEATSVEQIADEMGVTKGALYHYFRDKPDLVTRCYERSFDLYERFVVAAIARSGNGLSGSLVNSHLNIQAQAGTLSPLMPQPGFGALETSVRGRLRQRARSQNETLAGLLRRGMDEGAARKCDALLVTHICAGAIGWLPKWLPQDTAHDARAIADSICELFRLGLKAR